MIYKKEITLLAHTRNRCKHSKTSRSKPDRGKSKIHKCPKQTCVGNVVQYVGEDSAMPQIQQGLAKNVQRNALLKNVVRVDSFQVTNEVL